MKKTLKKFLYLLRKETDTKLNKSCKLGITLLDGFGFGPTIYVTIKCISILQIALL